MIWLYMCIQMDSLSISYHIKKVSGKMIQVFIRAGKFFKENLQVLLDINQLYSLVNDGIFHICFIIQSRFQVRLQNIHQKV